ncbi:hypothetical protein DMB66_31855 [Actinoplanes sp. ATCC 53533]|uniref:hypothetical protein n=1 Tax=Actinoplanes sp. ATCC 53533 TaxID=1288362 RepID=UPI000F76A717|nr:hypothetical protein [Actinoplanes sp. ATCC 53533]RSM57733.1 hypothetical protein DMB66_31855 [Actinoplanes sp. ATCC 53533]
MTANGNITRAHITARDSQTLREILKEHRLPVGGPFRRGQSGETGIDVYANPDQMRTLRSLPVEMTIIADETEVGEARRAEIADEQLYREPGTLPKGLGKLTGGAK